MTTIHRESDADLAKITKEGLAATKMHAYPDLSEDDANAIVAWMRTPVEVKWSEKDIVASLAPEPPPAAPPAGTSDLENLTAVVERGTAQVWVMENERVLDKFPFTNVHGVPNPGWSSSVPCPASASRSTSVVGSSDRSAQPEIRGCLVPYVSGEPPSRCWYMYIASELLPV